MLDQLREAYFDVNVKEHQAIQNFINKNEAKPFKLEAWDWSYYSNKLQTELFDINDEILRPYFELEKVKAGVFGLANKLYGIRFEKCDKIQVWNDEVDAYEVFDENGNFIAIVYTDFFPRDSKRAGAWMNDIKPQSNINGKREYPFITLTMNFSPATADKPALLTFDEVTTFLHEFGHGLHHMLSKVDDPAASGINGVEWDAVEMPSQFMENFAWNWDVLQSLTAHVETGEALPRALFDKMIAAKNFQSGMGMVRQLEFALFDMQLHTTFNVETDEILELLKEVRKEVAVTEQPNYNRFPNSFSHIFAGGYAAGYYSYKWAEVLSSDAFSLFEENGILDQATGQKWLHEVLEVGSSRPALDSFIAFRGRKPSIEALLRHSGIEVK
jgi:oligopeptidase A